ncbi:MAG: cation diffusion facilitator family transporter [Bacteroidetes bacterium]|nr:cation diffusion facilitator family transporter [Bacteroidota bacterium]
MKKADLTAQQEKKKVALISVFAAVLITGGKLIIGLLTGSIGILSEALHSGLDFVAAAITYFAVKIADKPADKEHQYGHGKFENLSAFAETLLLFVTCIWIVYEASHRLITGKTHIEVSVWSYIVVISSIIIDFSRSRALSRVAKKYNSQALEADALHFSTDIWSSFVVLIGLVCAQFGYFIADPIAALVVAAIVILIAFRLGKRSIDVLLDRASPENIKKITAIIHGIPEVLSFHDLKIRPSGAYTFVELNIHVEPSLTIEQAHEISHKVEEKICAVIDKCEVHVHEEPENNHKAI